MYGVLLKRYEDGKVKISYKSKLKNAINELEKIKKDPEEKLTKIEILTERGLVRRFSIKKENHANFEAALTVKEQREKAAIANDNNPPENTGDDENQTPDDTEE